MSTAKSKGKSKGPKKATKKEEPTPPPPSPPPSPPPQTPSPPPPSVPEPPPALEIDSTSQLSQLAPPATPSSQHTQTATKLDRTESFPSLVQKLRDYDFDDSSKSSILEAVSKIPEVIDETSLWNVLQTTKNAKLHTFLHDHGLLNAGLVLHDWVSGFTPPKDKVPPENEKAILKALLLTEPFHTVEYDVLAYLAAHVKTCVRLYREKVNAKSSLDKCYKGPFSAICQSSGMGKTRLALQLASLENMHVIYICCRPDKSGYPTTTEVIEPFIRKNGLDGFFWHVLLVAILTEYCNVDQRRILTNTAVRQQWLQGIVVNDKDGLAFWRNVLVRYELLLPAWSPTAPLELKLSSSAHFVFVFDEAASLATEQEVPSADGKISTVSILNCIRKELRVTGEKHNVFGLFMDTNSHVSNLFPPSDNSLFLTPSMREGDRINAQPKLVLPPFCVLPMCNPGMTKLMRSNNLHYYPLGGSNADDSGSDTGGVQVSYCPVTLALLSRPLFAMRVHREFSQQFSFRRQNVALKEIRSFAEDKLLGSTSLDVLNPDIVSAETDVARLAVLGCRYFLSTTSTLHKQLLVRQHMATCYGLSDDGKDLVVGYQSEPLLAEAAAELMLKKDAFRVLMEALHRMVVRGSLSLSTGKGEMGELVVCLALTRAFDRACDRLRRAAKAAAATSTRSSASASASATADDEPDSSVVCSALCCPIPLVEVLVEVYGGFTDKADNVRQQIVALLKGNALGQGMVMFNHFTKMDNDPIRDVASYKTLLRRGAAVLCKGGETARDIVIPVALPLVPDRAIDLWDRDSYVLTTWEIQVKNWQAAFNLYDLVSQMVSTQTTTTVDRGFQDSAQQHMVETTSKGPSLVTRSMSKTTRKYPVPILYSAFNTHADHSTDMKKEMGTAWLFDRHWAMSSLVASAATKSSTAAETAVAPAAVVETTETCSEGGEGPQDDTEAVAVKMRVTGLQLCGLDFFSMFDEAERDAIRRLLVVSTDVMTRLQDYHETFLHVTAEEAKQRVACLRPEYHEDGSR